MLGENSQNEVPHDGSSQKVTQGPKTDGKKEEEEQLSELDELRQKWSISNLEKRFKQRIENHITCNQKTKQHLNEYLLKLN